MPHAINVHARFYGLLKHFPHMTKEDLVWQYSGMLTTSLSDFYQKKPGAYYAMVSEMQKIANKMEAEKPKKTELTTASGELPTASGELPTASGELPTPSGVGPEIKKLRSAILHRLQKYGIDTTNWDRVNSFMENPRIAGKRLYSMSAEEMHAFIAKMEIILGKDKTRSKEFNRLASMN